MLAQAGAVGSASLTDAFVDGAGNVTIGYSGYLDGTRFASLVRTDHAVLEKAFWGLSGGFPVSSGPMRGRW